MKVAASLLALSLAPMTYAAPKLDEPLRSFVSSLERAEPRLAATWPGLTLCLRPTLIHFPGHGTLLFAHPRPSAGFEPLSGPVSRTCPRPYYRPGAEAPLESAFVARLPFAGTTVFAYRVEPDAPLRAQFETYVHEAFHLHQAEHHGPRGTPPPPSPKGPDEAALRMVEQTMLAWAFTPGEDWRERAKDFVAVRSARYADAGPSETAWEGAEERWEGAAEFVGYFAAVGAAAPENAGAEVGSRLMPALLRQTTPAGKTPRSAEVYSTGAAVIALLERSRTPWRERLAKGEVPFDILRAAFRPEDAGARVKSAKAAAGYAELKALAALRATEPPPEPAALLAAFRSAAGLRLVVSLWDTEGGSGLSSTGGGSHRIGRETLHPFVKTAEFARAGGLRAVYRDTSLISRPGSAAEARRIARADVFPHDFESLLGADPGMALELDGRPAETSTGTRRFRRLRLSARRALIEAERPGELRISPNRIHILFDPLPTATGGSTKRETSP